MIFEPIQALGENVICFTTSIHGGVSQNAYSAFNLGSHVGDISAHVNQNRKRFEEVLDKQVKQTKANNVHGVLNAVKWMNQAHTTQVLDYSILSNSECDGVYTQLSNTPLVVMTADCMPIMLYCSQSHQLAALHAGWRGLMDGIIETALSHFAHPEAVKIWIGPSICKKHFEVSLDVVHAFDHFADCVSTSEADGKWCVNLPMIAEQRLLQAGVEDIQIASNCTYQNKDLFSHRRAKHAGFNQTGRMATVIMRTQ